jgi:hypothetical protein
MAESEEDKVKRLTEELEEQRKELERLGKQTKRTQQDSRDFYSSIGEGDVAIKGLTQRYRSADVSLRNLGQTLKKSIAPASIMESMRAFEDVVLNMTRQSMGQTREVSEGLEKTILNASNNTALFGITIEDNLTVMKEMNDLMQVNTFLTSEQVTNMGLLAKNAGVSSSEIASIVKGFADMGVGTDKAINNISNMQKQARTYGINVGQFMKTIGSNVKMLSSYNFKEGVEGFSKMLAKAQALRIDVSQTFSLAEKLMDPEQAIEMAAGFQMLGGAVGDLADPFMLLNMAQTNVGGIQDAMLNMAESAVTFNKETGEFDIPVTEMYRLREAAKLAGKSYEEFSQDAIKAKQRTEKLNILDAFGRYTEEQKELISNLAEFDGGELKVRVPGFDEAVNVANLGQEELEKLQKIQEDAKLSDRDIALKQLSTLEVLAGLRDKASLTGLNIGQSTPVFDDLGEVTRAIGVGADQLLTDVFSPSKMEVIGTSFSEAMKKGFQDATLNEELFGSLGTIFTNLNTGLSNMSGVINEQIGNENIAKSPELLGLINQGLDGLGSTLKELNGADVLGGFTSGLLGFTTTMSGEQGKMEDLLNNQKTLGQKSDQTLPQKTDMSNSGVTTLREQTTTPPTAPPTQTTPSNVNVGGTINLTLNGTQTLSPDVLQSLLSNPEFKAAIENALKSNSTY